MELLKQPGGHVWVAEAPDWKDKSKTGHLKIAMSLDNISGMGDRGLTWALGQMYGVVGPGLIFTEHVFRGLRRDMYVRDDKKAATKKLAATWAAKRDAELVGPADNHQLSYVDAAPGRIFAVYISPNEMLRDFPDIYGWAEHWAWIAADPGLSGAPIEWDTRYDTKLWSREGN